MQVAVPLIPAPNSFVAAATMRTAAPAPTFAVFAVRASVAPPRVLDAGGNELGKVVSSILMTTPAPDSFVLGTAHDSVFAPRAIKATDSDISSIFAMDIPAAEFVPRNVAIPSVIVAVALVSNEFNAT